MRLLVFTTTNAQAGVFLLFQPRQSRAERCTEEIYTQARTHAYTLHKHLKIFLPSPLPHQSYIICQVEFFNQCKPKKDLGNLEQVPKRDRFPNEKHDFSVEFFGEVSWFCFNILVVVFPIPVPTAGL